MKYILFFILGFFLCSCYVAKNPSYSANRKQPGNHLLVNNKKTHKENMRSKQEHDKASKKKRDELSKLPENNQYISGNRKKRK